MGGTIMISEDVSLLSSTLGFDSIVEHIRPEFRRMEQQFREQIYLPLDQGGMTFISLIAQTESGFNAFARAAETAYLIVEADDPYFSKYKALWDELLRLLKEDPRYNVSRAE